MDHEQIKHLIDVVSIGGLLAALAGLITPLSIIFTFIWTLGRLVEMWTGKTIAQLRQERKERGKKIS